MRHTIRITLLLVGIFLFSVTVQAQDRPLIAIDPGHGGAEIGVEHAGLLEKDLIPSSFPIWR